MKHLIHCFVALAFAVGSASALEPYTFYSADKAKSFKATLADYDAKKKKVTVVYASGKKSSFALGKLSEESQKYVLSKKDLLTISKNVRLRFAEVKGNTSGETTPTHYDVTVYNRGKNIIDNVELKYTIYYRVGNLNRGGTDEKTASGTLNTGKMFNSDTMMVSTQEINLVRAIRKPQGSG